MSDIAIKVEGIGKRYKLMHKSYLETDSLTSKFVTSLKNIFNVSSKKLAIEDFWALQDINFEIKKGDRVGIIGRNGAGKSTLLKILSSIVKPTTGKIEYYGKMASLLEVGTGFHGDLSGRENIYLNGSILGMTKSEINAKFDEIVAFSEVEQFIDTPVKRYSSGMYVRLAFAVAAHLDPEIMIVDEVLAVGDVAFQKKSIGKMEESSQKEGKTILFVSHNMGQISAFCNKGILLNNGKIELEGSLPNIINSYFNTEATKDIFVFNYENDLSKRFYIKSVKILNTKNELTKNFAHNESIVIEIEIIKNKYIEDVLLGISFSDMLDRKLFTSQTTICDKLENKNNLLITFTLPHSLITPNTYNFTIGIHVPNIQVIDEKKNITSINVYDNGSEFYKYVGVDVGNFFVNGKWDYKV